MSDSECVSRTVAAGAQVRSGKQDLVEQQNIAPNAKFCLKPLRAPTEEGAKAYTFDLSVPKIAESFLGEREGAFFLKKVLSQKILTQTNFPLPHKSQFIYK